MSKLYTADQNQPLSVILLVVIVSSYVGTPNPENNIQGVEIQRFLHNVFIVSSASHRFLNSQATIIKILRFKTRS